MGPVPRTSILIIVLLTLLALQPRYEIGSCKSEQVPHEPSARTTARPSAPWVKDAVIYEVYLRSFSPEGRFASLQARLPELRELGITVLWLMPIHPVGKERRKGPLGSPYAVKDYYAINPEFGTLQEQRAHAI
ncbi:MAG: hypothetical protein HY314_10575 [Acidobacteria bacterium]|nr:hypothetical protein [Acidobacteriota bacterium]